MIVRALWDALKTILDWLLSLFPNDTLSLPRYDLVFHWPSWLPFAPFATTATLVVGWIVVLGVYTVGQWIWDHIPTIAGFGTH